MSDTKPQTAKDDCIRYFLKRAEMEMQNAAEKWGGSCMGVFYARNDIKRCKEALGEQAN